MAISDSIMDTLEGTITVTDFRNDVFDWYEVRNECNENSVLEGAILDAFDTHDNNNIRLALCEYVDVVFPWGKGEETPLKKAINEFEWVELTKEKEKEKMKITLMTNENFNHQNTMLELVDKEIDKVDRVIALAKERQNKGLLSIEDGMFLYSRRRDLIDDYNHRATALKCVEQFGYDFIPDDYCIDMMIDLYESEVK